MAKQENKKQTEEDQNGNQKKTQKHINQPQLQYESYKTLQSQQKLSANMQSYQSETKTTQLTKIDTDINKSQNNLLIKKKIIKKFPFSTKIYKGQNDNLTNKSQSDQKLKNWQPTKLNTTIKRNNQLQNSTNNKKQQIASQFFSFIPKPKAMHQQQSIKSTFQYKANELKHQIKPLSKIISEKITEQQRKWDGEDQFLQKNQLSFKNIASLKPENYIDQKLQNDQKIKQQKQQDENVVIQKIEWLNQDKNKKSTNLATLIQNSWQKQSKNIENYELSSDEDERKFNLLSKTKKNFKN